ncbi:MFS transporter [Streptomyces durbertensis]|uniref:MFS transporter n=2 Tax=Streptomyces durbertensis TaxID=2448886 RepID=A0ABR6EJR2_9ACTN|nr:MFS transporter [Streptomyces durbertensis]
MFLTGFAALAVVPTLPTAARDLDGVALFPLVAGCFVAASLLGGVAGGHWADRVGARRPLAVGMAVSVLTLLVSASSVSVWQLAAGRFFDGLASGVVAVSVVTAIGQAYPDHLRPAMLAMMSTSWVVPSLVGPPLAGLVVETWSWRVVFYGLAVLTLLPTVALVAVLRGRTGRASDAATGTNEGASRPPLLAAATLSVGAALGQYGVSGWDARHLPFAVAGLGLLVVFAPRLLPAGTWRAARGLPTAVMLRGMASGTFFTIEAFVPLMLITERQVSPVVTGMAFTAAAVLWAGASWVQGGLLAAVPRHRMVVAGAAVMACAVGLAVIGSLHQAPAHLAAAAMPLAAVGMGLLDPCLTVLSLRHSPPGRQGYATSSMQVNMNLGQVVVMALTALVLNAGLAAGLATQVGYACAFGLLLVPSVLVALLAGRARATSASPSDGCTATPRASESSAAR